jgi:S-DNA-T family DNA segregation ATPase FtsK/SpoIIIE
MSPGNKQNGEIADILSGLPEVVQRPWMGRLLMLGLRFRRFAWDVAGVLTLAFALMTLLALLEITQGRLLLPWATFLRRWLGLGSGLIVIGIGVIGLLLLRQRLGGQRPVQWKRVFALEVSAFALVALLSVVGGVSIERAEAGLDGGLIGWGLAEGAGMVLGSVGRWGFLILVALWGGIAGFGLTGRLSGWVRSLLQGERDIPANVAGLDPAVSVAPVREHEEVQLQVEQSKKKRRVRLPPEFRKSFRVEQGEGESVPPPPRDDRLPPLSLLGKEKATRPDERNINLTAGLIEKTLAEFGIPAKVVGFQVGPTVTQFAVEPGYIEKGSAEGENNQQKVRVSQISALSRDIALALSAERLRIQAPVPGRPFIGIEVPNVRSTMVRLRPILESESFYKIGSPLSIALGRNVSGEVVVADLSAMPHLLIAGTTGSGKSVCIAALTTCLAVNNSPEDLRIVMIDPKMVELVRFNGLPHLYGKVETDLERILGVLRWTVAEMDRRYKLLEELRARDIQAYNRKARRRKNAEYLPRIVVMIDELADLMMTAPEQTEPALVRLAQMARATGIHLVVATQRPSTDVVTGLIKANFPARLSFAVASSVDSRVILDTQGAESLLGRGDMLFLPPEAGSPMRIQGVMVTDHEVEQVITYWQQTWDEEVEEEAPPWEDMLEQEALLAEHDDLIQRAVEIVRTTQRASASLLQRRLRVGYPRAARLIDELEELGIVGPSQGAGREREVIIDLEDENPFENVD